jgi:UMF1 family MFS transporter
VVATHTGPNETPPGASAGGPPPPDRGAIAAWCLFDWASNAWPTVITTFVFAAYVTKGVAPTAEVGTAWWGTATSIAALFVALSTPIAGAVADRAGRRKPWIAALTLLTVVVSALLWTIEPDPSDLLPAVVLVALGVIGFEAGQVFYNAMLAEIAPPRLIGRVSGWAWGLGYAGGLGCLGTCLGLLVLPDPPLLPLDPDAQEPVRFTGFVVAAWFALFSVPFFWRVPDRPSQGLNTGTAIVAGFVQIRRALRELLPKHRRIAHFLLARMLYTDGLTTLFSFGGVYAAGTFGMDFQDVLIFGIVLNVTAGLGAAGFAWVDDWIGPKRTILISLVGLIAVGVAALLVETEIGLYIAGSFLGVFFGPAQAASRSLMARMAPAGERTEMFGLYALSGKATAFIGPALVGWVTYLAGSQRVGMATILVFFIAGLALLIPLKTPAAQIEA